jgi:hypothetical protein
MSDAFNTWADKARAVLIQNEIDRRGIKLRGGVERYGPCPKCGGDDRFSINISKQVFNCRGCGIGGDVIALVEHLDGVDFTRAAEMLAGSGQSDLTAMTGIARENLSRILQDWERRQIVSRLSGYYCLEDKSKLEREVQQL